MLRLVRISNWGGANRRSDAHTEGLRHVLHSIACEEAGSCDSTPLLAQVTFLAPNDPEMLNGMVVAAMADSAPYASTHRSSRPGKHDTGPLHMQWDLHDPHCAKQCQGDVAVYHFALKSTLPTSGPRLQDTAL